MSAKEFRISNIVIGYDGRPYVIDLQFFVNLDNGVDVDEMIKEPIPITHEWLLKLGFALHSKHSFHNYQTSNGWVISMWMKDKPLAGFEEKGVCYWGVTYLPVKYVHQLQNLYFATTNGQELNYTL